MSSPAVAGDDIITLENHYELINITVAP